MKPGDVVGYHSAMNPLTGEFKWKVPITGIPNAASVLGTAGGLLFTGRPTGEFMALDEDTGETLWQFKTGSSINAPAITYTHKGTAVRHGAVGPGRQRHQPLRRRQGSDAAARCGRLRSMP